MKIDDDDGGDGDDNSKYILDIDFKILIFC